MMPTSSPDDDHSEAAGDDGTACSELGVADYLDDLSSFYRSAEGPSRPCQYFPYLQPHFDAAARCQTVERLIQMHQELQLTPETLFLTVYVLDAYLSLRLVNRRDLTVVGVAAMLLASKYDDDYGPRAYHFGWVSGCPTRFIVTTEKDIVDRLEWNLSVPTPYVFLMGLLRAAGDLDDEEMKNMVFFFAELALTQYQLAVVCRPSMLAASAVYAARCTLDKKPLWTEALCRESGYPAGHLQLLESARCLVGLHAAAARGGDVPTSVLYTKYSDSSFGAVALYRPATAEIEEAARPAATVNVNVNVNVNAHGFLSSPLLNWVLGFL